MKSSTTSSEFFQDDPWERILEPCYPQGRRLYLNDERFWVSMDDAGHILFFVQDTDVGNLKPLENLDDLEVSIEGLGGGEKRLVCKLQSQDADLRQKFGTIAKDVAYSCSMYSGTQLFTKSQQQIKSWANFLRPSRAGLLNSEFIGFLGELYILSEHLMQVIPAETAVRAWIGPEGKKQDFTHQGWAAEVKTSLSGDQQTVKINSLDQLDRITDRLYLLRVIAAPADDDAGYCLEELYANCWEAVSHDVISEGMFLRKASRLYGDASQSQIKERFLIVDLTIYCVDEKFPKLTRSHVDVAITDAQYELSVGALTQFRFMGGVSRLVNDG